MMDPSKPSECYQRMSRRWRLPLTLMGGNQAMREASGIFLPRHPAENDRVYRDRISRTVLKNYYRRTVKKLTGRVFGDPLNPSEDVPPSILALLKNTDCTGRGLNSFAKDWFEDALVCGLSHVLVDFPVTVGNQQKDARPYAVHIPATRLIDAEWEMIASGHRLTRIRIREESGYRTEIGGKETLRVRTITPDHWSLHEQNERGHWSITEEGINSLGDIPLVTLYTNRVGFMEAAPPLEDLAYLNLEHYQIRSDQRNALNVASFPILAASGYDPEIDGPIEVGPNKVLTTSDTGGRYYYVESTGAALEAGARELAELEKAIQLFGLQFETGSVPETATGRTLDAIEAIAPLDAMVTDLEDSLNNLLAFFGRWLKLSDVGMIVVSRDHLRQGRGGREVADLLLLEEKGVINRDVLTTELRSRGILKDSLAFNSSGQ